MYNLCISCFTHNFLATIASGLILLTLTRTHLRFENFFLWPTMAQSHFQTNSPFANIYSSELERCPILISIYETSFAFCYFVAVVVTVQIAVGIIVTGYLRAGNRTSDIELADSWRALVIRFVDTRLNTITSAHVDKMESLTTLRLVSKTTRKAHCSEASHRFNVTAASYSQKLGSTCFC